jgi:hypothetical protein
MGISFDVEIKPCWPDQHEEIPQLCRFIRKCALTLGEAVSPSAAKLVVDPAGESPAGGNCPVATVVISGNGEGDRTVESPEVKVSCKGGKQLSRS